jgi:hypothetical protein
MGGHSSPSERNTLTAALREIVMNCSTYIARYQMLPAKCEKGESAQRN